MSAVTHDVTYVLDTLLKLGEEVTSVLRVATTLLGSSTLRGLSGRRSVLRRLLAVLLSRLLTRSCKLLAIALWTLTVLTLTLTLRLTVLALTLRLAVLSGLLSRLALLLTVLTRLLTLTLLTVLALLTLLTVLLTRLLTGLSLLLAVLTLLTQLALLTVLLARLSLLLTVLTRLLTRLTLLTLLTAVRVGEALTLLTRRGTGGRSVLTLRGLTVLRVGPGKGSVSCVQSARCWE